MLHEAIFTATGNTISDKSRPHYLNVAAELESSEHEQRLTIYADIFRQFIEGPEGVKWELGLIYF
jgi:hypothetical protein